MDMNKMNKMSEKEIIKIAEKLIYEVIMEDNLNTWYSLSPYEKVIIIKKLLNRIDELENHIHYKECIACGKEFKSKRKDAKYCVVCARSIANRNYYLNITEEQKQKRREQAKICMRKIRNNRKNKLLEEEKQMNESEVILILAEIKKLEKKVDELLKEKRMANKRESEIINRWRETEDE